MTCPDCGFECREDAGFCGNCGTRLGSEASAAAGARSDPVIYADFLSYSGLPGGLQLARQAVAEADELGDREIRVTRRWALAPVEMFAADVREAERTCTEALDLIAGDLDFASAVIGYSPYLFLIGVRAGARALLGRLNDAQRDVDEALRDRGPGYLPIRSVSQCFGSMLHCISGDTRRAVAYARSAVQDSVSAEVGPEAIEIWIRGSLGHALLEHGYPAQAIEALEHSLELAEKSGTFQHRNANSLALLARAQLALGNSEAAQRAIESGFAVAERGENQQAGIWLQLVQVELELAKSQPDLEEAERRVLLSEEIIRGNHCLAFLPLIHTHCAGIRRAADDSAGWRHELESAAALYRDMGAIHQVGRIEARLADYSAATGV